MPCLVVLKCLETLVSSKQTLLNQVKAKESKEKEERSIHVIMVIFESYHIFLTLSLPLTSFLNHFFSTLFTSAKTK